MKRLLYAILTTLMTVAVQAQERPLWLRFPSISPDGKTIAFCYKGNIFTVSSDGGEARQLTTNAAYDSRPIWSPDGTRIAFASDREGSMDVYVVSAGGGRPLRLTATSANELPLAWRDNSHLLFSAAVMPTAQSIILTASDFPQVYEVEVGSVSELRQSPSAIKRPRLFSCITMEDVSVNADGDLLYHDYKGYEDTFRKHHQSAITRDVWLKRGGSFTKLTNFRGEDRSPVWTSNGKAFFYLSEQDGNFNVWYRTLDGSKQSQITHHKQHPVRFLSVANDGTLCYSYDGEIYTLNNVTPRRLEVSIATDQQDSELTRQVITSGATEIRLSPNGKEIAFIMHGDVYVTSIDYKTTRRITDTPEQERHLDFSPDGRSLAYSSERDGVWQIYQTNLSLKSEKIMVYATELVEERLTHTQNVSLQPKYSPDGREIAFFENRADLKVLNLQSKAVRTVLDGRFNYSYSDGDLWCEWSPDSRWLLSSYIGVGGWHSPDVALVNASGNGEVHNLTDSGYSDGNAKWALGGRAVLFSSDRAGYRSHGSWGAEEDVYLMFFDLDAYERFRMTKEERALADEAEKEARKAAQAQAGGAKKKGATTVQAKPAVSPLELDLENCRDRIVRLTVNSSHLGDAVLSPKGDTLYYQASFEGGYDLWKQDLVEHKTELVLKDVGRGDMQADAAFKTLYVCARGIKKIDLSKNKTESVAFEAQFNFRPYEERQYLFDHVWRQVKEKFYDVQLHGIDWSFYHEAYSRFLPHISNNYDFRDMLSEMLGELNGSHTGARYYPDGPTLRTASLGLFFDPTYDGDGLKVEEVIKRGPFAVKKTGLTSGCIIEKIDGYDILAGQDYSWMLDGKAGKTVRVAYRDPRTGRRDVAVVKPVSQQALDDLIYRRWVDRNRHLVDSLSGGRLAYVHVKAMNSENFRKVYSELLGDSNRNRDAVIVDERGNGGGWLHDDLCTLLSGREYHRFMPNGKYVGRDPLNKWVRPSCVLMNEDCYSNGSGFPWVYRELGIGKLIGTPVAGTATSVWWETLMDRSLVFGIPQVGKKDKNDAWMENQELLPDIEVYNTPEDLLNGHDRQLETAIAEMMKVVK